MIVVGAIALLLLVVIAIFAFPVLSPIPYYPTNRKDLGKILSALNLKSEETLVDLGAGDGLIIFEAARLANRRKMHTRFVADEINPILFLIMQVRRLLEPNRKQINIVLKNMFRIHEVNLAGPLVFYLYVSPWFLERIYKYLKKNFSQFRIISYFYEIPGLKPKKIISGEHKIFVY